MTAVNDPAAEAEALAVVEAAFEAEAAALNSGDVEALSGAQGPDEPDWFREWSLDFNAALVAAAAQVEVSRCDSGGFGEWDMGDEGLVTGYLIICEGSETNSFYAAGELDPSVRYERVVNHGQVVSSSSDVAGFGDWLAFNTGFRNWMRVTHPDVYDGMRFLSFTTDFPAAESMPTALEYVDEFVAQSDVYPISP